MKILTESHFTLNPNSSLNRGKWTFTSFISLQTEYLYLNQHLKRLCEGADYLFPECHWIKEQNHIKVYLMSLFQPNTYYRINICEDTLWVYQKPFDEKTFLVKMTLAQTNKAMNGLPHYLKIPNYLLADVELEKAKKNHFEDVLFLDENKNIAEASTSNIFFVSRVGKIYTPPLSSVVLQGIMRERLINCLNQLGFEVFESETSWAGGKWLEDVSEVWLTNSTSGVRFVEEFAHKKFEFKNSFLSTFLKNFDRYGRLIQD